MAPTDDQLREYASHHLKYDVLMLRATQELMALRPGKEDAIQYALLESFLIHTRVLMEFLYEAPKPDTDDVRAKMYCASWSRGLPQVFRELEVKERIGVEVAHANLGRLDVEGEAKGWNHPLIRRTLDREVKAFAKAAKTELIEDRTREVLEPIKVKTSMIEGDMTSGLAGLPPTVMSRLDMRLDGTSTRYLDPNDAVLIINPGDFKLLP